MAESETPLPSQQYCPGCNRICADDWSFCPSCGTHLNSPEIRTDGGTCEGGSELSAFEDLEYVHAEPGLIRASAIGSFDGKCAVDHYGVAGPCTGEPEYRTTIRWKGAREPIALCPKHAGESP